MQMKIVRILVSTLALLMILGAVSPALAYQTNNSFTFGAVNLSIPNTGATFTSADKIEHARGIEGMARDFGHPWGSGASTTETSYNINVDSSSSNFLTGSGIAKLEATYATGKLELIDVFKFEGIGLFVYNGPTFTTILPVYGTVTITHGATFHGLLDKETSIGHGSFVSGNVNFIESANAVTIMSGPLAGLGIVSGTGTYVTTR